MVSPTGPAPVEEMAACAAACAQWLFDEGYTTLPEDANFGPGDIFYNFNNSKMCEEPPAPQASAVIEIHHWLWHFVLPAFDERRTSLRKRVAEGPAQGGDYQVLGKSIDPVEFADLCFGPAEHDLASRLRDVTAKISALKSEVDQIADRQTRRGDLTGQATGDVVRAAFERWLAAGATLRDLVEPTGRDGIAVLPVPHVLSEWNRCRRELELHLHAAGFTTRQITQLLPRAGSERTVEQRRYRARRQLRPKSADSSDRSRDPVDPFLTKGRPR